MLLAWVVARRQHTKHEGVRADYQMLLLRDRIFPQ